MNPEALLILILVIIGAEFLLERVLDFLNLSHQNETLPEELQGIYNEEKYNKSLSYYIDQTNFTFITSSFSLLLSGIMIGLGGFGWLDKLLHIYNNNELLISLLFFGLVFLASDLLSLPFQVYKTFFLEEKYGFNKTTVSTFISDKIKGYVLALVVGGLILTILLSLIKFLGPSFWIYFWVVISAFIFFINMFYTSIILPLFNKLTPLEEGELKNAIQDYAVKVDFPLDNIYVIDGSKRSSKANAFFSGIGKKKKVVLYDTLIKDHTLEELVAILAHEVGHFKKKHIISGMIISILQVGAMLFIMSQMIFNENLSIALGATDLRIHLNLVAFAILFSPVSMLTGLFLNMFSRKNEFEADSYASLTYSGKPLQEALKKLSVNNLSNLTPHKAYVFFHYSHPPLLQRLRAIDKLA